MALAEVDVGCVGRKVTTQGLQVEGCEIASREPKVGVACIPARARVFQVLPSTQQNDNHLALASAACKELYVRKHINDALRKIQVHDIGKRTSHGRPPAGQPMGECLWHVSSGSTQCKMIRSQMEDV